LRASTLYTIVVAGGVLYLVLDIAAQLLPPHYNPISTAESDLAVGPYGYVMTLNFVNRGLISLAFLGAFSSTLRDAGVDAAKYRTGIRLLGVWGVGALLLAAFPTDVPATPVSWHGLIHLVVALLAFLGECFGVLLLSLRFAEDPVLRGARSFALPLGVLSVLALCALFGLPFLAPHFSSRVGGLSERVLIGSVLAWTVSMALYLARRGARAPGPGSASSREESELAQ
jgi:hypothetical protein